ncbi:MAG: hypothetical protein R3F13_00205 [Prosthecobacter sp.]
MKQTLRLLILVLPAMALSSCYVEGRGHAHVKRPSYQPGQTTHTSHHYHKYEPAPQRSRSSLINANTNIGVRL